MTRQVKETLKEIQDNMKAEAAVPQRPQSSLFRHKNCVNAEVSSLCLNRTLFICAVRYELHPGVCGSWGVWRLLPIPLENVEQPITRWASDAEPVGHVCVGPDFLHPLQEEDLLENLTSNITTTSQQTSIHPTAPNNPPQYPAIHLCVQKNFEDTTYYNLQYLKYLKKTVALVLFLFRQEIRKF